MYDLCPDCKGEGRTSAYDQPKEKCERCGGEGRVRWDNITDGHDDRITTLEKQVASLRYELNQAIEALRDKGMVY